MNKTQELIGRSLEEFTQVLLIALTRRGGGRLVLNHKDIQDALGHCLHVGVGSQGIAVTVVVGAKSDISEATEYFEQPREVPPGWVSRVAVSPISG